MKEIFLEESRLHQRNLNFKKNLAFKSELQKPKSRNMKQHIINNITGMTTPLKRDGVCSMCKKGSHVAPNITIKPSKEKKNGGRQSSNCQFCHRHIWCKSKLCHMTGLYFCYCCIFVKLGGFSQHTKRSGGWHVCWYRGC